MPINKYPSTRLFWFEFYEPNISTTMRLLLRRTLVRSVRYSAKRKLPFIFKYFKTGRIFIKFEIMNTKILDKYITHNILNPQYRNYDIEGAPYKIGERVTILDNPSNDETFDKKFSGKEGVIIFYEYDCGCGQTFPTDPMIGVKFANGRIAEFWKEEICIY